MGGKKRKQPTVEEALQRPWCYYCERDFEDDGVLIGHQKAKHFKCDRCARRLNTAGGKQSHIHLLVNSQLTSIGLRVHMEQVHKEALLQINDALPNRADPNAIEIFGTVGIPEDIVQQHFAGPL